MSDAPTETLLLDVNVLVSLALSSHQHHRVAHETLRAMTSWATTPLTESALVRLLLNPKVVGRQLTGADSLGQLRAMRNDPRWRFLPDDTSLSDAAIATTPLMCHSQVTDFHLVNVAAIHGALLATFDRSLVGALAPADLAHLWLLPVR